MLFFVNFCEIINKLCTVVMFTHRTQAPVFIWRVNNWKQNLFLMNNGIPCNISLIALKQGGTLSYKKDKIWRRRA